MHSSNYGWYRVFEKVQVYAQMQAELVLIILQTVIDSTGCFPNFVLQNICTELSISPIDHETENPIRRQLSMESAEFQFCACCHSLIFSGSKNRIFDCVLLCQFPDFQLQISNNKNLSFEQFAFMYVSKFNHIQRKINSVEK